MIIIFVLLVKINLTEPLHLRVNVMGSDHSSAPRSRGLALNVLLKGEVPSPANPPSGCYFHPRFAYAAEVRGTQPPGFRDISPGHFVACDRTEDIELPGVDTHGLTPVALAEVIWSR